MPELTPAQKILLDQIGPLQGADIVEKLAGGPANDSWLLRRGNERFVARFDQPLVKIFALDRRAERDVLHTVSDAGIGPQVIWSDPDKGVLVTSWIPGSTWSITDIRQPIKLRALAATLRQLHSLPPHGPAFAPGKMAMAYARGAGTSIALHLAEQAAREAEKLLSETGQPSLCHNDLVHSNIIGEETVKLIDWEYSAVGDPYFDLAIVVRHHQLEKNLLEGFLTDYFGTAGEKHFSRLDRFCRLYDQLAALWYLSVTGQAGHDAIYDEELERVMARF